jgi:glycosyltransferase involved in cell wall biosynthesis
LDSCGAANSQRADPIRIAMIADFPEPGKQPVGGPQVAVKRLVRKLVELGVGVVVISPHASDSTEAVSQLEDGVALFAVPAGRRWTLARGLQPWRRRAGAVVDRMGVDIVHGQGLIPGGIAAADVTGRPRVVTARGNMRADTISAYSRTGGIARAYLRDRLARRVVERADVVIGVNPDWPVNLPSPPRRFVYIPNMIDEDFFNGAREPEPGLVLFAGGTREIKGWPLLAKAWSRVLDAVPKAHLNIIGWPAGESPQGIAAPHRGSLIVEPWLSSAELAKRMRRATALVIPSQFEVSPIVLAEAWAVGLPVVAVPVGGIAALATDAAILVERQAETLAAGIVTALAGEENIDRLVDEGRRRAEAHRPDAVAAAHVALYQELVHGER